MTLSGMRLVGDVPPFTDLIEIDFNDRVNVFIGPNASGKSTVLMMLADHLMPGGDNARPIPRQSRLRRALRWSADDEDSLSLAGFASQNPDDGILYSAAEPLASIEDSIAVMGSLDDRFSAEAWADVAEDRRAIQLIGDEWLKTIAGQDPQGQPRFKRLEPEIGTVGDNAPGTIWVDDDGNYWIEASWWTRDRAGTETLFAKGLTWVDVYGYERTILFDMDGEVTVIARSDVRSNNALWVDLDWFDTDGIQPMRGDPNPPELKPAVIHIESIREPLPGITQAKELGAEGKEADEILEGRFTGLALARACLSLTKKFSDQGSSESHGPKQQQLLAAIALGNQCSQAICNEVILDGETRNYVADRNALISAHDPLESPQPLTVLRMLGINTKDVRNFEYLPLSDQPVEAVDAEYVDQRPIYLGHLSSGTAGTLLWIRWLALKMLTHYKFAEGWEDKPAILLIDEIENHLHPTWQRRVIPALLEHFPGLQIFATTHSPFVVAGLKAGQVHLLNRDADGVVRASTNTEDIVGWTADEILRVYMGVDDPTDDVTAKAARELRALRDEGPRSDEREEEERQAEILRLRQIVDRVELSGPRVAENERFLANLDAILERHIQSQSLNQENG